MHSSNNIACPDTHTLKSVVGDFIDNVKLMGMTPKTAALKAGIPDIDAIQTWEDLASQVNSKLKGCSRKHWTAFVQQSALGITGGQHEHKS